MSVPSSFSSSKTIIMQLLVAANHSYLVDIVLIVRDSTLNEEFGS